MKKIKPMQLIFTGTIITVIGAFITGVGTYLQNISSSAKSDHIKNTGDSIRNSVNNLEAQNETLHQTVEFLQGKSSKQLDKIQELTMQNALLSSQLSKASNLINDNLIKTSRQTTQAVKSSEFSLKGAITGGDSYAIMNLIPMNDHFIPYFTLEGNNGLKDITVSIKDNDKNDAYIKEKTSAGESLSPQDISKFHYDFRIAFLNPSVNQGTLLNQIQIPFIGESRSVNIDINASNGNSRQTLLAVRLNGKWLFATRITMGSPLRTIFEDVEIGFPKENVEWRR